jgi:lactoylglutathione lyase
VTAFRDPFPILYVEDVARSIDFYVSTLGFEVGFRWEEDGETTFAFLRLEPSGIGVAPRGPESDAGRDFELCLYADAAAAAARLRAAGAKEVLAPQDEPWGERRACFHDPDRHLLHVAAKLD